MPKPFPKEFREDVVRVARSRDAPVTLSRSRRTSGSRESCLHRWLDARLTSRTGKRPGPTRGESAELREAAQADQAARAGERGAAPRGGVSVAGEPAGKMMYPLVRELAVDGIPVTVTCRVLKIARQPYYRWLADPVTDAEWLDGAPRERAVRRPPRRPGVRLPVPRRRGPRGRAGRWPTGPRGGSARPTAGGRRSASQRGRNGKKRKPGTPAFDDLVAARLHRAGAERAVAGRHHRALDRRGQALPAARSRTCYSNRIVGYSIDSRMKSRLAVAALNNAVARRAADRRRRRRLHRSRRPRVAISIKEVRRALARHGLVGSMGQVGCRRRQRRHGVVLLAAAEERPRPAALAHPRAAADRDRHLDRTDLPPPATAGRARPIDPHRIRGNHDHNRHPGGLTEPVTRSCSRPLPAPQP